jgi:CRP/FNR family transcriptional regulator, cyclic AMP receptor protein
VGLGEIVAAQAGISLHRYERNGCERRRLTMHWNDLINSVGSLFIVATASTKTMVPLRVLAIFANFFLIAFYAISHSWVPLVLQTVALPLNGYRLYQMLLLIRNVRSAIRGTSSMDWLKPFMTGRHFRKGDILFAKGEAATEMFCTVTGRYLLLELGIEVAPGQVVGELAMLAPDNRRTATLECIGDGDALSITYEQVEELYYQNPTFGFYFLRLATERLFDNINRLQAELEQRKAAQA